MDIHTGSLQKSQNVIGTKYWLFQVIPPLSMLGVLFVTDKGPALVFLTGLDYIYFQYFLALFRLLPNYFLLEKENIS